MLISGKKVINLAEIWKRVFQIYYIALQGNYRNNYDIDHITHKS